MSILEKIKKSLPSSAGDLLGVIMQSEQFKSALRTILKIAGTVLVEQGWTNNSIVDAAIGLVVALVATAASYYNHAETHEIIKEIKAQGVEVPGRKGGILV